MSRTSQGAVRLGIAGCGNVSMLRHLPALRYARGIRAVALADMNPERLQEASSRFQIAHAYSSVQEMLESGQVEAVAVCVPPGQHREIAELVLESGKHLLLEKPIARTLQDGKRILEAAARAGKICMTGFNLRRHRLVQRADQILRTGKLGKVQLLRTQFTSGTRFHPEAPAWRLQKTDGGLFREQAIHHFDLWRRLLDSELREVSAFLTEDDSSAVVAGCMQNGVLVQGTFSEATSDTNEIVIAGTKGQLRLSLYRHDSLELLPVGRQQGSPRHRLQTGLQRLAQIPAAFSIYREGGDYVASYRQQWEYFAEKICSGGPVDGSLEDGYQALKIAVAAENSAGTGHPVVLQEIPA